MEARKVQVTGGSTYTVSLPKPWAREMRLDPGDMIYFERMGDSLVLRAQKATTREPRTKTLEVGKGVPREHVLRNLIGAYMTGYQFIELRFGSREAALSRAVARDFSRMVIGAEVVEETSGRVLIQDLANPMDLSPDKCVRRMYMTVQSMTVDSMKALASGDAREARDVLPRDQDVDRLYWMVAKQYHLAVTDPTYMVAYGFRGKLHHLRTAAKLLERAGDHAEKIAHAVTDLGGVNPDKTLAQSLEAASELALHILDKAFMALMKDDLELANEALDLRGKLSSRLDGVSKQLSEASGPHLVPLVTIADSLSRIGGYASDIAEVAINSVIGSEG